MNCNLIVAICKNNGIGYKGKLPWHIPQDLQNFAKLTKGEGLNAVIMGHKTWQSLPVIKDKARGLPQRDNFILSRNNNFSSVNKQDRLIKSFKSVEEVETYTKNNAVYEELWVIGGAEIYKQFLAQKKVDYCYVTYIDKEFECDAFFPELDSTEWKRIEQNESSSEAYNCSVTYIVYKYCGAIPRNSAQFRLQSASNSACSR
jgi:dihydrofolate reductase